MVEVKNLEDKELDIWVARALGYQVEPVEGLPHTLGVVCRGCLVGLVQGQVEDYLRYRAFRPSTDWKIGGLILASARIAVVPFDGPPWVAYLPDIDYYEGGPEGPGSAHLKSSGGVPGQRC